MMRTLSDAGRRRIARLRRCSDDQDDGFAMIYVLMITMMITIGVLSALVITAGNIVPAKQNQDDVTALAAARAGLEDYIAFLNDKCTTFNGGVCKDGSGQPLITSGTTSGTVTGTSSGGTESYDRSVLNAGSYLSDGYVRVKSTGKVTVGTNVTATQTLVADIAGLPNVLNFAYLSKYETLADAFVRSYFPARTVAITKTAAATAADKASPALTGSSTVQWAAPTGTDICDKLWYDDSANPLDPTEANPIGADADPAYQNPGRGTLRSSFRTNLPIGADWSQASTNAGATLYQPCEVTFTSGMTFSGPVYSKDALYLSYGTTGGTGPKFTIPAKETLPPVSTGWRASSYPGAIPGQVYRQFPYILGAPSADSTFASTNNTVQTSSYDLQLPTDVVDAAGSATCIYTGPTRVKVSGSTATIISPLTTAEQPNDPNGCYHNTASGYTSPINATGVTSAQVPISSTTIYVRNGGTGTTSVNGSAASPIFSLATPASSTGAVTGSKTMSAADAGYVPALLQNPSTHPDGQWTPQWTGYTNVAGCLLTSLSLLNGNDLSWFNCSVPRTTVNGTSYSDSYSYVKAAVQNALTTNPANYLTPTAFASLLNSYVSLGNTSEPSSQTYPNNTGFSGRRYAVTAVADTTSPGCNATSTSTGTPTPVARPTTDSFLSTASTGYVTPTTTSSTTCLTATVTLQVGMRTSNLNGNLNSCNQSNCGWGDGTTVGASIPQFKVTAKVVTPATQSNTTSTVIAFPDGQDVTRYPRWDATNTNAPGDLYVEGTGITGKLSLVAQNDVVVTGPLTAVTASSPSSVNGENAYQSGGAMSLVAKNNVRLYHPVGCAVAGAGTTPGYCANDITGLYSGALESSAVLAVTHPAMQYCNLTTGYSANAGNSNCSASPPTATGTGPVSEIDAAVFALNGSLMTDNFNRGVPMLDGQGFPLKATVWGGLYQLHRGATGQQWEAQPTDTSRAVSGYTLQDTFLALGPAGLPYVPALKSGKSNRSWNIVSVSSG
jgi:hypothetical protein